ncbi:MAG: SAM-dependent methyltransferase [Erythrobacter cryptus]
MPQVTMVGLGPGHAALVTREAWEVLSASREVWLRTAHHPCAQALPQGLTVHSFDAIYERAASFEALYQMIAEEVLRLARRPEGVVYAVPGDPLVGLEAGVIAMLGGREAAARASWQSVLVLAADGPAAETARAYLAQLGPEGDNGPAPILPDSQPEKSPQP